MNTYPVEISPAQIAETIQLLRDAGHQECILLWLGRREQGIQRIVDVYKPIQEADKDYFVIPRQGMAVLMERLRTQGLYVVSQVHTHPGRAFHSHADDKWAIVRHTGALSIVLPFFAESTTVENFLQEAAVFQLDSRNRWNEVASENVPDHLRVTP
ncbi:MAG: Mov34/MPN/PAD-1 family protein [Candidatus Sulfotelmatobacter sp.]